MADQVLLGIDLGAGSLKCCVVDPRGVVCASASADVATLSPRPGFSEQHPQDWYRALCESLAQIWRMGVDPARIGAVSLTAGAHTHVLEDENGAVIRPAIMWNDQRSDAQCTQLTASRGSEILSLSGNRISPTWTLPQLAWLAENEPDSHRRIARIFPAKDWLRNQLDGSFATDITDAWGLMLADVQTGAWSKELCALAGIEPGVLPGITQPFAQTGSVLEQAAKDTGLRPGTPVICGTSDTNAETFAAGMVQPGTGVLKLATAGTVAALTPDLKVSERVIHYPHLVEGHYYSILGTNSCASAHRWLRDSFFATQGFEGMDQLAGQVAVGSEGLLFHPYLNGERSPYWDSDLRASFVGIGFALGPGHFARAFYEGVAFSLRDCLDALQSEHIGFDRARLVGGGARSAIWAQIVADVTGCSIEIPSEGDASFGAALIAGLGINLFQNTEQAVSVVKLARRYAPQASAQDRYQALFALYRQTKQALTEVNHSLAKWQKSNRE